jgi:hypothetical protein
MKKFFYKVLISLFGIFVDIWNWYQTKQMFRFIQEDYKELWESLDMQISPMGVMYSFVEYQSGLSERHYKDMIHSRYDKLSECTIILGLSGLISFEYEKYLDDEENDKIVFLVKYIPQFQYISFWNVIKTIVLSTVIILLFVKYNNTIFDIVSKVFYGILNFII